VSDNGPQFTATEFVEFIIIIKLHAPERAFQHTITIKRLKYAIIYMQLKMVDRYNVQLFKMCFFISDLKCLIFLNDLIESGRLFQCLVSR
jgi:hypothetical protein